jgi:S1-C subfamily serine protease
VAVTHSNALWRAALTGPSTVGLDTVKTGGDLSGLVAEVEDLLSNGEHWRITPRHFSIRAVHLADDGRSGWVDVEKSERRALYGPDKGQSPLQQTDNTYLLRYNLINQRGRWLVNSVAARGLVPNAVATGPALSVEQIAARTQPSIMHVEADSTAGSAVGTGFVVATTSSASYVITNNHVVSGGQVFKLQRWLDGRYQPRDPWIASKVWQDAADDLAVIRIEQGRLPVLPWGNSDALPVGEQVVAIGYAENLSGGPTVTEGIVSSLQRTSPDQPNGPFYIGHSAIINHGNSGGPLLDLYGRVVGINTWTLDNTQGLFFAIPSTRAARVAAGYVGSNG